MYERFRVVRVVPELAAEGTTLDDFTSTAFPGTSMALAREEFLQPEVGPLPVVDADLTKRVKDALSVDLVVEAASLLRLLVAADVFPNGGLYSGPWAQLAVRRYSVVWLPLLLQLEHPRDREGLIPPLDVALVWLLHRTADIHSYVEDCTAIAFSCGPEREPELLNVGPAQCLAFSDGSDAAGALSGRAWSAYIDGASQPDKHRSRRSSSSSRSSPGRTAPMQPYWPPQLGPSSAGTSARSSRYSQHQQHYYHHQQQPQHRFDDSKQQQQQQQLPQLHLQQQQQFQQQPSWDRRLGGPPAWEDEMRGRLQATLPQAAWLLGRLMQAGFTGSAEDLELAVERYCRFLLLAQRHQFEALLFPPDVLLVWWAHKAHSSAYLADMDLLMGCPFDPIMPASDDALLARRTAELYESEFGDMYNMYCPPVGSLTPAADPDQDPEPDHDPLPLHPPPSVLPASAAAAELARRLGPLLSCWDPDAEEGRPGTGPFGFNRAGSGTRSSLSGSLRSSDEGLIKQFHVSTHKQPRSPGAASSTGRGSGCGKGAGAGAGAGAAAGGVLQAGLAVKVSRALARLRGALRLGLRWRRPGPEVGEAAAAAQQQQQQDCTTAGREQRGTAAEPGAAAAAATTTAVGSGAWMRDGGGGGGGGGGAGGVASAAVSAAATALAREQVAAAAASRATEELSSTCPHASDSGVAAVGVSGPIPEVSPVGTGDTDAAAAVAAATEAPPPSGLPMVLPLCSEVLVLFNQATAVHASNCRHRSSTGAQTSITIGAPPEHVPRAGAAVRYALWLLEKELSRLKTTDGGDGGGGGGGDRGDGSDADGVRRRGLAARLFRRHCGAAEATEAAGRKGRAATAKALAKAAARHAAAFRAFGGLPMRSDHPFWWDCCPGAYLRVAATAAQAGGVGLQPAARPALRAVLDSRAWEPALGKAVAAAMGPAPTAVSPGMLSPTAKSSRPGQRKG